MGSERHQLPHLSHPKNLARSAAVRSNNKRSTSSDSGRKRALRRPKVARTVFKASSKRCSCHLSTPPHEDDATYFGLTPPPTTLPPSLVFAPVVSNCPMPILLWSPARVPKNCAPVSTSSSELGRNL